MKVETEEARPGVSRFWLESINLFPTKIFLPRICFAHLHFNLGQNVGKRRCRVKPVMNRNVLRKQTHLLLELFVLSPVEAGADSYFQLSCQATEEQIPAR